MRVCRKSSRACDWQCRIRRCELLHAALFAWRPFSALVRARAPHSAQCVAVAVAPSAVHCSVPSVASMRIVLAPVCRAMRLKFFEAWNATVGGAYSTLAYTHRTVAVRRPPGWAATARLYAWRQYAIARCSGDGELQFKCCVWLAYAEAYEWRWRRAQRWLRSLRALLKTRSDVQALVGVANVAALVDMVKHAQLYCRLERKRVDADNEAR